MFGWYQENSGTIQLRGLIWWVIGSIWARAKRGYWLYWIGWPWLKRLPVVYLGIGSIGWTITGQPKGNLIFPWLGGPFNLVRLALIWFNFGWVASHGGLGGHYLCPIPGPWWVPW